MLVLVGALAGSGCDTPPPECDALLILPAQQGAPDVQQAPVDIYIDATPSMLGYLEDAYFEDFVRNELVPTTPASAAYKVYRSGSRTTIDLVSLGEATTQGFYSIGDTDLVAVLDSADSMKLSVLVTDLFPTDVNTAELSKAIAEKYIEPGLGVGLLTFPLDFEGTVYDVQGSSFHHQGERPLYLVLLGPVADIEHYRAKLLERTRYSSEYTLITKHLAEGPATTQAPSTLTNAVFDQQVDSSGLLVEVDTGEASFSVPINLELREAAPHVQGVEVVVADVETCAGKVPDSALDATAQGDGDRILLTATLPNGSAMPKAGYARYHIQIKPSRLEVPRWVIERDMDLADLAEWKAKPESFDGTKTLGIRSFVQRLLNATMQTPAPHLGDVYLVITQD